MRKPEPIAGALKRALTGLSLDQRLRESQVMRNWASLVGETTAAKTRPLSVNRGVLNVQVISSAWAHQLNLLKPKLMKLIAQRFGPDVICDIRFRSGTSEATSDSEVSHAIIRPRREEDPVLDADEEALVGRLARGVPDPKLQERVGKAITAYMRRKKRLCKAGWLPCQRCKALHDVVEARREASSGTIDTSMLCPVCRLEYMPPLERDT